jgi:hypothetical protein
MRPRQDKTSLHLQYSALMLTMRVFNQKSCRPVCTNLNGPFSCLRPHQQLRCLQASNPAVIAAAAVATAKAASDQNGGAEQDLPRMYRRWLARRAGTTFRQVAQLEEVALQLPGPGEVGCREIDCKCITALRWHSCSVQGHMWEAAGAGTNGVGWNQWRM